MYLVLSAFTSSPISLVAAIINDKRVLLLMVKFLDKMLSKLCLFWLKEMCQCLGISEKETKVRRLTEGNA